MHEIRQYTTDKHLLVARYRYTTEAARALGCSQQLVSRAVKYPGKYTAAGFHFDRVVCFPDGRRVGVPLEEDLDYLLS